MGDTNGENTVKYEELSDGRKVIWDTDEPHGTALVYDPNGRKD